MAKLTSLGLGKNQIGDEGMQALSSAIANGALPSLQNLAIYDLIREMMRLPGKHLLVAKSDLLWYVCVWTDCGRCLGVWVLWYVHCLPYNHNKYCSIL